MIAVSDSAGASLSVNRYDEYGIPTPTNLGRFGYTGQAWIPSAQLYYYKARVYHPVLGRFMQPDPIGYGSGMNLYAYVGNDPVNFVDPLGLETCPDKMDPAKDGSGGDPGCGTPNPTEVIIVTASKNQLPDPMDQIDFAGMLKAVTTLSTSKTLIRRWQVRGVKSGFVGQRVKITYTTSDGRTITLEFFEAWPYEYGQWLFGNIDSFEFGGLVTTLTVDATAAYYEGSLPTSLREGGAWPARDLPSQWGVPGLPRPSACCVTVHWSSGGGG